MHLSLMTALLLNISQSLLALCLQGGRHQHQLHQLEVCVRTWHQIVVAFAKVFTMTAHSQVVLVITYGELAIRSYHKLCHEHRFCKYVHVAQVSHSILT